MDEQHTESRLRDELRHAVDHLEVSPDLWARIRRRHRREPRQRMLAVATSTALLAIVVAAAFPLVRDAADTSQQPPGQPRLQVSPTPLPTGIPPVPPERWDPIFGTDDLPPLGPPVPLSRGSAFGRDWTFVAYKAGDGVCYGFLETRELTPGPGRCSGVGDAVSPAETYPDGRRTGIVYGFARKDVDLVQVVLRDGKSFYSELQDREELPVRFYLGIAPEGRMFSSADIRQTIGYDAAGDPLGAAEEPPPPAAPTTTTPTPTPEPPAPGSTPLGLEPATGPVVTLDSGEIDGLPWEFAAHRWAEGICYGFLQGGGAVCDPSSGGDPVGIGVMADSGEGQLSLVWGAMPRDTEVIRIRLPDGQEFDLPPLGQDEFGVSFFVMAFPPGTPVDGVRAEADPGAGAPGSGSPGPTTTTPNG